MRLLDYFISSRRKPGTSAKQAKERLQIIVAREGAARRRAPDFLPKLKRELLEVVRKYVTIDPGQVKVHLDQEGDYEVLELNIALSESDLEAMQK
jgi:cell division topological specificity factor